HLNDGEELPQRSSVNNAHAYLAAPYGIYQTADGWLAIAMTPIPRLGDLIGCEPLTAWTDLVTWFTDRDVIKQQLAEHLRQRPTADWLEILEPADIWCAEVLDWHRLRSHEGFAALAMTQQVSRPNGATLVTTRCPIRIDGGILSSGVGSPSIGEHTAIVTEDFHLGDRDSRGEAS
ncbi:MAG: CoA transferase, partial [Chloroflexota bacterium]